MADEQKTRPKAGQPTKYKPEYCAKIVEWFSNPVVKEVVETVEGKNWSKETTRYVPVFFPTFETFAAQVIEVDDDTLVEWAKKHKEFSAAYKRAKAIQKGALLEHAMLRNVDSNFAQFFAINTMKMESRHKVENTDEITVKYEDMTDDQINAAIEARKARTS